MNKNTPTLVKTQNANFISSCQLGNVIHKTH